MIKFNKTAIAPPNAKWINVYDKDDKKIGIMPLYSLRKPINVGEKLYSFAAVSDIHIGNGNGLKNFNYFCSYCNFNEDIKFILNCGDTAHYSSIDPSSINIQNLVNLANQYNNEKSKNLLTYQACYNDIKNLKDSQQRNILNRWDTCKNRSSQNWENFNKIKEQCNKPFISIAGNHEPWMYEFQEFLIDFFDFETNTYYKFSRPVREPKSNFPIYYLTTEQIENLNNNFSNKEYIYNITEEKYYKIINNEKIECEINYANIWELNEIDNYKNIINPVDRQAIYNLSDKNIYIFYNNKWNLIILNNNQAIYLKQSKKFLNYLNGNLIDFTNEMEEELFYLKRYTDEKGEPFFYLINNTTNNISLISKENFYKLTEEEQENLLKNSKDVIIGNGIPTYNKTYVAKNKNTQEFYLTWNSSNYNNLDETIYEKIGGFENQGYSPNRNTLLLLHKYYEKFRNKRCFILQHFQPQKEITKEYGFIDYDLFKNGENKGYIDISTGANPGFKYLPLTLQQHYKNTLTFYGHKHWKFLSQGNNNYKDENEIYGFKTLNCPSLRDSQEGYIIDVYKNYLHIQGVEFKENNKIEYNSKVSYLVDTTVQEIAPMSYQPNI